MNDSLVEAFRQVADHLNIDSTSLATYSKEDGLGGYPGLWPPGTIWEPEGKLFYALTRFYKPSTIVEVGSFVGCSTAHWTMALDINYHGAIHCFDISFENFALHSARIHKYEGDALKLSPALLSIIKPNILFIDGPKDADFVRDIIKMWLPVMDSKSLVLVHDIIHEEHGDVMRRGFREAVGDFRIFSTPDTECGCGYWQKP